MRALAAFVVIVGVPMLTVGAGCASESSSSSATAGGSRSGRKRRNGR